MFPPDSINASEIRRRSVASKRRLASVRPGSGPVEGVPPKAPTPSDSSSGNSGLNAIPFERAGEGSRSTRSPTVPPALSDVRARPAPSDVRPGSSDVRAEPSGTVVFGGWAEPSDVRNGSGVEPGGASCPRGLLVPARVWPWTGSASFAAATWLGSLDPGARYGGSLGTRSVVRASESAVSVLSPRTLPRSPPTKWSVTWSRF